ncbi:MAG TPA: CocE/NonD family hydrolase [bacterium]|nr:CocE/NonD family hydrolase [bacterium]HPN36568.1 CocE/NonD family hydrolase [bacterium]
MKKSIFVAAGVFCAVILHTHALCLAVDQDSTFSKSEVIVAGADTVRLATDLYLPKGAGPFPCILLRTPYNKNGSKGDAEKFVNQGYAVVVQDCRGTGKSKGRFYAFRYEREDGLATVDWIRTQSWSNGRIGGWGGSYVGYTQWIIADKLNAIAAALTTADMYDGLYPSGLFSLALAANWGLIMNHPKIKPEKLMASYRTLPLSLADDSTGAANAFFDDWLRHPHNDDYWQAQAFRRPVATPAFSIAGWYDIFLEAQIKDFVALGKRRHPNSRLIIGPFAHGQIAIPTDYGDAGKMGRLYDLARSFLAQTIKDPVEAPVYADSLMNKPFAYFIIHANKWVLSKQWPPEQSKPVRYYLGPSSTLSTNKPTKAEKATYVYDPQNPYPSLGGTFLGIGVGPAWQNSNVERTDQVVFESDTLSAPLTLLGPLQAELYVASDAASTDFFACLQDVQPDGKIVNIQEGGQQVQGGKKIRRIRFSLWAAGYQLAVGHKLRVVICSSLFPRYNRNLNNGEPIFSAARSRIATQTVSWGPKHPSHLILPIIP